jgi:hypothetical protein
MIEKLKGYKSVVFFVLALLVALANLVGFADFSLTSEQTELIAVIVPLVGLALRYLTDSPIFQKEAG